MARDNLVIAKDLVDLFDPDLQVTVHTINHWANLGILQIARKVGRRRYFDKTRTLAVAKRVRDLQNQNYPLTVIAETLRKEQAIGVQYSEMTS